jgi:hypothetical protein
MVRSALEARGLSSVKQNTGDSAEALGVPYYNLGSSCPGAQAKEILHSMPSADQGVAAARPMGKRWLCLYTTMTDDLTQQETICR